MFRSQLREFSAQQLKGDEKVKSERGKMMAGKWYRLAGWDIGRDRERRMRDFVQNL